MKCSACEKNQCEGKYEHRDKCVGEKEEIKCTCICRITRNEAVLSSALSIGAGVAFTAAGIGLTVVTGGMAAIIAGAALAGSGTSLVFSPIQKHMSKECVTLKGLAREGAIGATIGAVTGPIGAIGSIASKGASAAVQIGARIVAGSSAGAVTGVLSEGAKAMQGEEVTLKSVTNSALVGAAVGTIGGASSQLASGVTRPITNEVGKAATRIAVQGSSAAVADAGVQLVQSGTVNPQRLILNTAGKMTISTTAEVSSSVSRHIDVKITDSHNKKPILIKGDKNQSPKTTKLKEEHAANKPEKKSDVEKSHLNSPEKPQNMKQHREVQPEQAQSKQSGVSESFNQKLMGTVHSSGLAFSGMMSSFNAQMKNSYDHITRIKSQLDQHDEKDEKQESEEIHMKQLFVNKSIGYTREDMSNVNESTDLQANDLSLNHQNINSVASSITENSDLLSFDESVPVLMKIDYDLLLEAQDSNPNENLIQSDLDTPFSSDSLNKPQSGHNNEIPELRPTFDSSDHPVLSTLTTEIDSRISHRTKSIAIDQGLDQLSLTVSKVISIMEDKASYTEESSASKCVKSQSTYNHESPTHDENEVVDASCHILQVRDTFEKIKELNQQACKNDEIDNFAKAKETINKQKEDVTRSFGQQQPRNHYNITKTVLDHRESSETVYNKTNDKINVLNHRTVTSTTTKTSPKL